MTTEENVGEIRSFYQIAEKLDAQVEKESHGYRMTVEATRGQGFLYLSQVFPGFYLKVYDLLLQEDLDIELNEGKDDTLRINHVSKGNILFHKTDEQQGFRQVKRSSNLFLQTDSATTITYRFPSGKHIQLCSMVLEKPTLKSKKHLESSLLKNLLESAMTMPSVNSCVSRDNRDSRGLASQIISSISTKTGSNLVTEGSAIKLLGFLISTVNQPSIQISINPEEIKQDHIKTCLRMTKHISKTLDRKFIVAELAKEFKITVRNLQAATKYIYGVSVAEHISNIRLSAARKMIQNKDQSINEIRKICGFNSFSYFSQQFNAKFGYSPREYQYTFFKGNDIFELCYRSTSIEGLNEIQLRDIVSTAISHNKNNDITGCLLHQDHTFFQIIEGRKDRIMQLFDKIKADKRHSGIEVLWRGSKKMRNFGLWNMALVTEHKGVKITYENKDNNLHLSNLITNSSDSNMVSNAIWSSVRDRLTA